MLMYTPSPFVTEPKPRIVRQPAAPSRRAMLARIRDEIAILSTLGYHNDAIARMLSISEDDAHALSPNRKWMMMRRDLSRRALNGLLYGRHAHVGGRTVASRVKRLADIAAAYTREELLQEPGIGSVTATEIQLWLDARGFALRPSPRSGSEAEDSRSSPQSPAVLFEAH